MPEVNSARKPLPVGVKPEIKRSPAEAKLDRAGEAAKKEVEAERDQLKAKTQRLKEARLAAEAAKK